MVAIGSALTGRDHRWGGVDRIDRRDASHQEAGNLPSAAAHVEDVARFRRDQADKDVEQFRWVGRTMPIGVDYARCLEGKRILSGLVFRSPRHFHLVGPRVHPAARKIRLLWPDVL